MCWLKPRLGFPGWDSGKTDFKLKWNKTKQNKMFSLYIFSLESSPIADRGGWMSKNRGCPRSFLCGCWICMKQCVCVGCSPSGQRGDGKGWDVGFHTAISGASYQNMFIEWENSHAHISLLVLPFLLKSSILSLQSWGRNWGLGDFLLAAPCCAREGVGQG